MSFFASNSRSTCVRLVLSSVAMRFFEIFFSFIAWASCQATTSLTACACASSKTPSLSGSHRYSNPCFSYSRIDSLWCLRANANSSSDVVRVFLMKPCSATKCSLYKHSTTRAVRFVGRSVRISQRPLPIGRHSGIPTGQRHCARNRSFPMADAQLRAVS
jgi:hypothetical protein